MKVEVKVVVRDKIINKQSTVIGDAMSHDGNQMTVMDSCEGLDLSFELTVALSSTNFELFHGYDSPIW